MIEKTKTYAEKIVEAATYLRDCLTEVPSYAIILGTGAQHIAHLLTERQTISYQDIPHFEPTTAPTHLDQLHLGKLKGRSVLLLEGRYHYYEGYSIEEITFAVRVLGNLGVGTLLMTNAAGGLLPGMQKSDLLLVRDHINLQPKSPLRGPNLDDFGPRFPDMSKPYDAELRALARRIAQQHEIPLKEGIYVCVQGPQLETPAEYEYLSRIGGELVGMSTAPEVIVARHMGMRCCVLSVVSDLCYPAALEVIDISEVLAAIEVARPRIEVILSGIIQEDAP